MILVVAGYFLIACVVAVGMALNDHDPEVVGLLAMLWPTWLPFWALGRAALVVAGWLQ